MLYFHTMGSRSHHELKGNIPVFRAHSVTLQTLELHLLYFHVTWHRCLPHCNDIQTPRVIDLGPWSRSHYELKDHIAVFRALSITLQPLELQLLYFYIRVTWHKCSPHCSDVQSTRVIDLCPWSRSHHELKGYIAVFHINSVTLSLGGNLK